MSHFLVKVNVMPILPCALIHAIDLTCELRYSKNFVMKTVPTLYR